MLLSAPFTPLASLWCYCRAICPLGHVAFGVLCSAVSKPHDVTGHFGGRAAS